MNISESFLTALDSLLANKLRSVLTMLGIIIGVAAVITLMSLGNGFSIFITQQIQSIGTNLIYILPDTENSGGRLSLTLADVEALSDPLRAPSIKEVTASIQGNQPVLYEGRDENTTVVGVTTNYFTVNNRNEMAAGDILTQVDLDTRARVAVLGSQIAEDLFVDEFPIGKNIKIAGASYVVVGVLQEQGGGPGGSVDDEIYIPLTTAQARLFPLRTRDGQRAVSVIIAQAVSEEETDAAVLQITEILREQHDIAYASDDDFRILSQNDLLETFGTITGTLTLFLGAIAGISLFVGGIGIMNIMLVSVTERTREIGIRKSVGALRRDILVQFLIESLFMSVLGGIVGVVLGSTISTIAGNWLEIGAVVDIQTVLLATGFSAAVGLIFGIYPAWRAASLRPIDALRYE